MTERRRNILIGLFVLGGLIALGGLIVMFGSYPSLLSAGSYPVHAYFGGEVEQIEADLDVLMLGKRVGWVSDVQFRQGRPENGLDVTMQVFKDVPIPANSVVALKEAALGFGRSRLQILVPPVPPGTWLPKDGSVPLTGKVVGAFEQIIPKEMGVTLQQAVRDIGELASALTPAAKDLHEMFKPTPASAVDAGQAKGNLSSSLERLDATLRNVNDVIGDPGLQQDIRATVANLRTATEQANAALTDIRAFAASARDVAAKAGDVADSLQTGVAETREHLDGVAKRVMAVADQLSVVLTNLNAVAEGMAQGKGTMGQLLSDNRLYESLLLTTQRLNAALQDLQATLKTWQDQGVRIESLKLR